MTKTKKRKGFTLTELAIVIAVIAILIAVLVPTFTSLITSANESADEQAVKSMNTALATDEALNGTPDKIEDAMKVLTDAGYNVENYVALDSGNTIYYDATYNRCLVWSGSEVTYPADLATTYAGIAGTVANWYTLNDAYNTLTTDGDGNIEYNGATKSVAEVITGATKDEYVIIRLSKELSISSNLTNTTGAHITLDLNNKTLSYSNSSSSAYSNGSSLYLKNGTANVSISTSGKNIFGTQEGGSITFENVTVTSSNGSVLGVAGNNSRVNILNSSITTSGFCISTNASTEDNYYVSVDIEESILISTLASPIVFNVPGTYNVKNSTVGTETGLPSFVARGGDINIDGCTIYANYSAYIVNAASGSGSNKDLWKIFMDDYSGTSTRQNENGENTAWGGGDNVPNAALCIGNDADRTDAYQYPTTCTVTNTAIYTGQGFMCVYVEGNTSAENGVTFNYDNCSFYYYTSDMTSGTAEAIAFSKTTPTEYSSSLFDSAISYNSTTSNYPSNPLDYAIIYTNESESYVTINGIGYQAAKTD